MSAEARIHELGLQLPPAPAALGVYRPVVLHGGTAYLSGHVPLQPGGGMALGRVGEDLDLEAGRAAARLAGLAMLASLRASLGSLDRVRRVIKLLGMVNCTPAFTEQPAVINGCSELFVAVFGPDAGAGARSALGAVALPGNIAVEIEGVFAVD